MANHIGRRTTVFADGKIDNVIIYDHALSASEVLQLYQDGAVKPKPKPRPY